MRGVMRNGLVTVPVVGVFLVAALAGAGVLSPTAPFAADAQSEPVTTVNGIQLPPRVPGLDYTIGDVGDPGPIEDLEVPGTPGAPVLPGDTSPGLDVPVTDGAVGTNLGGSDVTVSSVGGSYEVDAPKKRSHRKK